MVRTKEERKAYIKEYNQSEKGKMRMKLNSWKQRGLVCDTPEDYLTIYYHWLASTHCEKCPKEFDNTKHNDKNMDHDHNTGLYRNILCNRCNTNNKVTNTSGTPNICWHKERNCWTYQRTINKKRHSKGFKLKEDAIKYKVEYEKENIYINNNGAT